MGNPLPTTKTGRLSAWWLMRLHAPELMAEVEALQKQFGGELTYFKAGPLEYGEQEEGWQIDQALIDRVHGPQALSVEQQERNRKEKLAAKRRQSKGKRLSK